MERAEATPIGDVEAGSDDFDGLEEVAVAGAFRSCEGAASNMVVDLRLVRSLRVRLRTSVASTVVVTGSGF
jgi:hypothetical protein